MARPSGHTDKRLIKAGRKLYESAGCRELNVRKVAEKAGVNLGMFHYHFRSKNEFLKRLLQEFYEDFFANFSLENVDENDPVIRLRSILVKFAFFVRKNQRFISALISDLMINEPLALQFVADNFERHATIMFNLIKEGQQAGLIKPLPVPQILSFMMPAVVFPIVAASRFKSAIKTSRKMKTAIDYVATNAAIIQRIDMALKSVSTAKRKFS